MVACRLTFVLFAAAILLAMVREWNAPVACARAALIPSVAARTR